MADKTDMKKRYELAYNKVLQDLPTWKRGGVIEDLEKKVDSHHVKEFVQSVEDLAEGSEEIFLTA